MRVSSANTSMILLTALALTVALLTFSAPARSANATTATIGVALSPDRLGAHAALTFTIRYSGGEFEVPAAVRRSTLKFPADMSISVPTLHSCSRQRLFARGAHGCPAQARLGGGHALVEGLVGSQLITEAITLSAFLGPPHNLQPTVDILGQGYTPYDQRTVLTGAVVESDPPYGEGITMTTPGIPTVPLEPNASIVTMSLTVGASRHRHASSGDAILVPRSCPVGGFPFAAEFTYADGSRSATTTTAPCPS
jgi:hypothetical protein